MRRATTAEVIAHTRVTSRPSAHTSAWVSPGQRQPDCPGRPGHRRWRGLAGPGSVPVVLPGRWPPLQAHRAGARSGRPVCGGRGASRWLLPGGQPGLPAALLARGRGGRIEVAVAWRRARELRQLRRGHQPPPGTRARCPRLAARARCRPRPPLVRRIVSRLMPAGRVRAGCDTGPGTCRLPGADRSGARPPAGRGTRSRSPGSSTPGPPGRGHGVVRVAVTCAFTAMARSGRRPGTGGLRGPAAIVRGWPVRAEASQASSHVWVCRYRCGPVRRRVPLVATEPRDLAGWRRGIPRLPAWPGRVARWAASVPLRAAVSPPLALGALSGFFRIMAF
jgi:hypothetical protein